MRSEKKYPISDLSWFPKSLNPLTLFSYDNFLYEDEVKLIEGLMSGDVELSPFIKKILYYRMPFIIQLIWDIGYPLPPQLLERISGIPKDNLFDFLHTLSDNNIKPADILVSNLPNEYGPTYLLTVLKGDLSKLSEESKREVLSVPKNAFIYADKILKWKDIPDYVYKAITEDSETAANYLELFIDDINWSDIKNEKQVVKDAIEMVSTSSFNSSHIAKILHYHKQPIPEILIKGLAGASSHNLLSTVYSIWGTRSLADVPKVLVDKLLSDSFGATEVANNYFIRNNKEVPESIIKKISESANLSYNLIQKYYTTNKEIPEVLINSIMKDDSLVYNYVNDMLGWENIPSKMVEILLKNPGPALRLAINVYANNGLRIPDRVIDAVIINEQDVIGLMTSTDHLPGYYAKELYGALKKINQKVPEKVINKLLGYTKWDIYFDIIRDDYKFKNIPEVGLESIKNDMILTNFNYYEEADDKCKEAFRSNPNFKKFYEIPKKLADHYNREFNGFIFHGTKDGYDAQALMDKSGGSETGEICVSTLDSNKLFRMNGITLVGKAHLRLLFDFDCYSGVDKDDPRKWRYATQQSSELNQLDIEKLSDVPKFKRIKEVLKDEHIEAEYYDEGFASINKCEWAFYVAQTPEEEYLKDLDYMSVDEFQKLLKSGEIIEYMYSLLKGHPSDIEYDDEYDLVREELTESVEYQKEISELFNISDIKEKIKNIFKN